MVRVEMRAFILWSMGNRNKTLCLYAPRHSEYLEGEDGGPEPIMDLLRSRITQGQEHGDVRSGSPFLLGLAYTAPTVMLIRFVFEARVRYDLLESVDTVADLGWGCGV